MQIMSVFLRFIKPCDNKLVSFISLGAGWHNYHHSFPWDYRASEFGSGFNITATIIEWFAKIGWAYDLKAVPQQMLDRRARRCGDGSFGKRQLKIKFDAKENKLESDD